MMVVRLSYDGDGVSDASNTLWVLNKYHSPRGTGRITKGDRVGGGGRPYSFTSTHPGLWRRTSMRVFIRVVLNRINALCSLQNKAIEHLLRISHFPRMAQGQENEGGRTVKCHTWKCRRQNY
jgi:hypothetical protein